MSQVRCSGTGDSIADSPSRLFETYRSTCTSHPELFAFVHDLEAYFEEWTKNIGSVDPLAQMSDENRNYLIDKVRSRLQKLVKAVDLAINSRAAVEEEIDPNAKLIPTSDGLIAALER